MFVNKRMDRIVILTQQKRIYRVPTTTDGGGPPVAHGGLYIRKGNCKRTYPQEQMEKKVHLGKDKRIHMGVHE